MKIIIDARFYGLENAGLGRYTSKLIENLSKEDSKNTYYLLLREKYFSSLKVPSNFIKVKAEARHYSFKEQFLIPLLLYKINPDITHFLHFNVPVLYLGKYIVTIHDLLMHRGIGKEATTRSAFIYRVKRIFYRFVFDLSVKRAKKIIVPSKFVMDDLIKTYNIGKDRVIVTYEGVSELLGENEVKSRTKGRYILYVGNAYPHKNLKTLLVAMPKTTNLKLVLVIPRDVFSGRLTKEIENSQLIDRVEIKYGVSDEELYSLYKNSECFVYPSLSEGFGLQGLEAMSVGTRLIASDIPIFHEIYGEHAVFFDPTKGSDLAEKIHEVEVESAKVRNKKLKEAADFVKKYSWKSMTRATLALYEGK